MNIQLVKQRFFFDLLLINNYNEFFSRKMKHCIDIIFNDTIYIKLPNPENKNNESNFPENWIPPIG